MDCFHDFCLVCDKQCVDSAYCSQSCRLADLETANKSALPSPVSAHSSAWSNALLDRMAAEAMLVASSSRSNKSTTKQPALKRSSTESPAQPRLQSSISRSSLSSNSSSSSGGITEQAHLELQEYFSLFDQTRAAKRRSSVR